ncbi:MAG: GNAT family N-acetyltransferase [Actinomycetota bacterium]|nr:GNAT family N-acetyltransferase [Actinomycetota bacterium]
MPVPDHVHRFWREFDLLFERFEPTWWGAVVTDSRFPSVWDVNYARVDTAGGGLSAADIEGDLLPALDKAGVEVMHVVSFVTEETTGLMNELSTRGHLIGWDLVMDLVRDPTQEDRGIEVEELSPGDELWDRLGASLRSFGIEEPGAVAQLSRLEREVLTPAGKRWFGVRDEGAVVSLAAVVVIGDVGYLDNVATFPEARGRGYASALTSRLCAEAKTAGAQHVSLFADPGAKDVVSMYERIGFRGVATIGSTRGPVPVPGTTRQAGSSGTIAPVRPDREAR